MFETLKRDVKYALALLIKRPAFSLIAVFGLMLGIGANTAVFSIVDALLLKPLPYHQPDQLVKIWGSNTLDPKAPGQASYPNFADWRDQSHSFDGMAAYFSTDITLTGMGDPLRLHGAQCSYSLFSVLGVSPIRGRAFLPDEDLPGGPPVAMISYAAWQKEFGANPAILDTNITIDDTSTKIVGVLPPGFNFLPEAEIWKPLAMQSDPSQRLALMFEVVGRLKQGVSISQAGSELKTVAAHLSELYPATNKNWSVRVLSLQDDVIGKFRTPLLVMLAAVFLVLLISCANVANLLLSHAASRQREVAIRLAVGANRGRIIRQLLTESVILAIVGGALGLALADISVPALTHLTADIPRVDEIGVDYSVLLFTLGVSIVTGIVFGLVPALQTSKADLTVFLKEGGRGGSAGVVSSRFRGALVVLEMAMSLMLLIGAGLLLKSFVRLEGVGPGFNAKNVVTFNVQLPMDKYGNKDQRSAFFTQTLARLKDIPGVESAGSSTMVPLSGNGIMKQVFYVEGQPHRGPEDYTSAGFNSISTGYFSTMQIPMIQGRNVNDQDTADSPPVVVISDSMARRYFPAGEALGKRIKLGASPDSPFPWMTVIGVVGDVKAISLEEKDGEAAMYFPFLQNPLPFAAFEIRSKRSLSSLAGDLKAAVLGVDNNEPIGDLRTMDQVMTEYNAQRRLILILIGSFAGVALLLASIGVYGVISYSVTQRRHELGIRIALGGRRSALLGMIVREGMLLAVSGVVVGIAAAFALSRFLATMLFNVSTTDATVFSVVAGALILVALAACLVPAFRAMRVDPIVTLRYE